MEVLGFSKEVNLNPKKGKLTTKITHWVKNFGKKESNSKYYEAKKEVLKIRNKVYNENNLAVWKKHNKEYNESSKDVKKSK